MPVENGKVGTEARFRSGRVRKIGLFERIDVEVFDDLGSSVGERLS